MTCTPCLDARHFRCERDGCDCTVCAKRPAPTKRRASPKPSDSKPKPPPAKPAPKPAKLARPKAKPARPKRSARPTPTERIRKTGPGTECAVDDCTKEVDVRGHCRSHYRRIRLYGSPHGGRQPLEVEPWPDPPRDLLDFELIPKLPGCPTCSQRHGHWPGCPEGENL